MCCSAQMVGASCVIRRCRSESRPQTGLLPSPFNAQAFLESAGVAKAFVEYGRGETVFTRASRDHVRYPVRR